MKTMASTLLAVSLMGSALFGADYVKPSMTGTMSTTPSFSVSETFKFTFPDLTVSMHTYRAPDITPGQMLPSANSYEIYSREGAIDAPVEVTFYLTPTFNDRDAFIPLKSVKVDITNVSNLFEFPESLQVPEDIATGFYYVVIDIDSANDYLEINEVNNMANYSINVVEPTPKIWEFRASQSALSWKSTAEHELACKEAFGDDARIASWQDIERFTQEGGSAAELATQIRLDATSFFLQHNGSAQNSEGDTYLISEGNPKLKLHSALESVGDHTIDLRAVDASRTFSSAPYYHTLCIDPMEIIFVIVGD